jgi:hypothetical protein
MIILCSKTCMFTTHMKYIFDYYELYFVKMSDYWQDNENDEFMKSMHVKDDEY